MRENINVFDHSEHIIKALGKGVLLNTNGDKFNSMVIGWGHLGVIWGRPTFAVYVREHRYTKPQLDRTREFTVSIPLNAPDPEINRICGMDPPGGLIVKNENEEYVPNPYLTNERVTTFRVGKRGLNITNLLTDGEITSIRDNLSSVWDEVKDKAFFFFFFIVKHCSCDFCT